MSLRDQILAADDVTVEEVKVPEWGMAVRVRGITAADRDRLEAATVEQRGKDTKLNLQNIRARLVAYSVVDEQGARVFSEEDIALLGQKSATAVNRVFEVASRLSGLGQQDLDQLTGNLRPGQSGDSSSA